MMRFKLPVVAWLAAAMLAGCGGGDSPSVNTQDAQERRRALAVAGDLVVAVAPTVVGLQMESERRISRTVYEYTFVVQARNDSPFNRSGVVLGATSSLAATDIVLGDLQFPSLPAGATANASNRLVLRHDRAVPFDASKIRWTDRTPVITGKVMDGYIRGATIYWDCNANRRFDLNEVSTISGPGGAYTIDPVPASGCHLYAQVGPNAVDEDHPGQTVGSAYQLAAVPGSFQLITPYTTLVHGMLNQEPGLSVALADDRLQKSIGFNCGSLLYDYIGNPNAVIACDTAIKTAAKLYREVLQQQPASMPYDIVVEQALERMQQLAANPGHAASLGLGLTPYIYVDSDYGALFRAWAAEHQPNPSIRAFTVRAGSSRATEQALRGFADFVGNKGSVASGFIDLHAVNDTDLQALMHQLRRAAEADPSLASQAEIAAARTRRSEMLAAAGALFIGGVDDETELVNLFTNDPQATWDLAKTLVLASASMALDGLEIVHFRPGTVIRPSRHTTIANARKALEKRKAMVERLQGESAYESAIRAWINYTNDPQQQTEEKLDEATALTIAAAIDVAKRLKDNPSQPSSLLALMSFANAAEMDRESQLRVFKDTLALVKDLIEVALPGNPIAAKVVATLDVAIQYFEVRFAAEDLVASAGNVQKERLDAATAAFRTEASRVMRDYFRAYIAAYQANLVLVDTSSHDFVDRVGATPSGDGALTVTSEGSFRMSYLPSLGGQVCTTVSASPNVMTFRCPAALGAALFELKTVDGAALPGAASWVESGRSSGARVAAGGTHTCALGGDGRVLCWGSNSLGELGDGSTSDRLTPTLVPGLSGVVALAAGVTHTCALTGDGRVHCWGDNFWGQLGDGSTSDRLTPTLVPGLSGVVALTAGNVYTCALSGDARVLCWGSNVYGQLGDGSTSDRLTPTLVPGLSGVAALAAGGAHTCALNGEGRVLCWGLNQYGQLGDGSTSNRLTPTLVPGLSGVVALAGGRLHTCALIGDGRVLCWGWNRDGQLGDGSTSNRPTPTLVPGLNSVVALDVDGHHTCALNGDARVLCWGDNSFGQLGDGSSSNRLTPTLVPGLSGIVALAGGAGHSCALNGEGRLLCWGHNGYGQLGDGSTTLRRTPTLVQGF